MLVAYFVGTLIFLLVHHIMSMHRIQRLGDAGRKHGENMYRLGIADGKILAFQELIKYYDAEKKPAETQVESRLN